ncbi:MAG TPA: glutamine cyclotransferase [Bacteroidales bacterium]|nr:glutamine cyclotransferase [Bacteroidales bacterium]
MRDTLKTYIICLIITCLYCSCSRKHSATSPQRATITAEFNADSAFAFLKTQVDFGPRTPGSEAHDKCVEYLATTLSRYADTVTIQRGTTTRYDGKQINISNIIASFNRNARRRVMLSAHYDSRPWADQDQDNKQWNTPIDGANDGASGVAVLLEIARQLAIKNTDYGIDIFMWDAEDCGTPQFDQQHANNDSWCLGTQYWIKNKHLRNYEAQYGILLDMVGATDAQFLMEYYSVQNASSLVNALWNTAAELGYGQRFIKRKTHPITDDHYYLNMAGIPTIDIIHYDDNGFCKQWHTTNDNISSISRETMHCVGHTVLHYLYNN